MSKPRNPAKARRFFKKTIAANSVPEKIVIEIRKIKYLINIFEQYHRFITRITKPMMWFNAFHSASATIAGIEIVHMIRKNQLANNKHSPFQVLAELAA